MAGFHTILSLFTLGYLLNLPPSRDCLPGFMRVRRRGNFNSLLSAPFPGPTVIVTHHAPSERSIAPAFQGTPLAPAYASPLDELVRASGAAAWIHGHVHSHSDYRIGQTRILCNPRGYYAEEPCLEFDPLATVDIAGDHDDESVEPGTAQ